MDTARPSLGNRFDLEGSQFARSRAMSIEFLTARLEIPLVLRPETVFNDYRYEVPRGDKLGPELSRTTRKMKRIVRLDENIEATISLVEC